MGRGKNVPYRINSYASLSIGIIEDDVVEPNVVLYKVGIVDKPIRIYLTKEDNFVIGSGKRSTKIASDNLIADIIQHLNSEKDLYIPVLESKFGDSHRYNGEYRVTRNGDIMVYHYGSECGFLSMRYGCKCVFEGKTYKNWYECHVDNMDPYLDELVRMKLMQNPELSVPLLKLGTGDIIIEYKCDHGYCNYDNVVHDYNMGTAWRVLRDELRDGRLDLKGDKIL